MSTNISNKRRSNRNTQNEIVEARVIANYGDPGIDEDYHFDLLSRFVIVMIEDVERIPTTHKWMSMFAIVERPSHLWVNVEGGYTQNPATQKRSDTIGNLSVGAASAYSVAGIPRINNSYQMGELIKIKKLATPLRVGADSFFVSAFPFNNGEIASYGSYGSWHRQGQDYAYIQNANASNALNTKPLIKPTDSQYIFGMTLQKYQYEAFALSVNASLTNGLVSIFAKTLAASNPVYNANGGYIYNNNLWVDFHACEYEDINIGNKQRVATSDCMPLIVATPTTFPTPKTRQQGTIAYNPTYATIIR